VDVVAVRSDVVTRPFTGGRLVAGSTAFAVLVAAAVLLGIRHDRAGGSADRAQQAVLVAARGEAVALTTIGYRTADRDLGRILAGATGALRTQFEKQRPDLPKTLARNRSDSRGTVLSSALESLQPDRAQALVAVDATVTGSDLGPSGVLKHYRMVMTLQRVDGRWLASNVAFAGEPQ
jgi:Mce-associated membrane protein